MRVQATTGRTAQSQPAQFRTAQSQSVRILAVATAVAALALAAPSLADPGDDQPRFLADRGPGVSSSMFGTYIEKGELIVYPFYEYYLDDDLEYQPDELGIADSTEFRGRYRAHEGLILLGYGVTDNLIVELEAAYISANLERSPMDLTGTPDRIEQSGVGDIESQLRWRWVHETESRPELFSYFEAVFPDSGKKALIDTPDWELKLGLGIIKGFRWGTVTVRGAAEYNFAESLYEPGEFAVEYLKRLSPKWRMLLAAEGTQDEVGLITELQWHVSERMFIKLNNGFGLTSKATDWAPEYGVVFRF